MKTAREVLYGAFQREYGEASGGDYAECALAALREAGYCVVPVEPTEAMLDAAWYGCDHDSPPSAVYRAMLAAAEGEGERCGS